MGAKLKGFLAGVVITLFVMFLLMAFFESYLMIPVNLFQYFLGIP